MTEPAGGMRQYRLNFAGDVMLGRLIDQLLPQHVHEPAEAAMVDRIKGRSPALVNYGHETPWGNTLEWFQSADLNLINLETAVTTHARKWPNKTFNYRMHPDNLQALKVAQVDYVSLANNHTLDFSKVGLLDTVRFVAAEGIRYAGAGETAEMARQAATLYLPRTSPSVDGGEFNVKVFAASDHPEEWNQVKEFHLLDYSHHTRSRLKQMIERGSSPTDLKIFSVHWGPNYSWKPAKEIRELAHFLIDECGIDIIHGHSSHHVQGVEVHNRGLIIYGCGDFVDDYALVPSHRNDLGALWQVTVKAREADSSHNSSTAKPLRVKRLEVFPTQIRDFQVNLLNASESDHGFVCDKIASLSADMDTQTHSNRGSRGQLVFDVS